MWAAVSASVIGSSHALMGTPCQDAHSVLRIKVGDEDLLLVAIADGAGTATHSHIGSSEAVNHLLPLVAQACPVLKDVSKEQATSWMQEVLAHLITVAEREGVPVRQLACTLLLGIVGKNGAVLTQLGDGGWVLEKEGRLICGTWPESGEYVNVATFLTSEGALEKLQFERVEGTVTGVAGFSDGLQALVLNYAGKTPHEPFFTPMFAPLRKSDDATALIGPLQSFLASTAITSRTDDDKTLVLGCWREPIGVADGSPQ